MASTASRIIFPHDKDTFDKSDEALFLSIRRHVGWVKIGLQAMTAEGSRGITTATTVRKFARRNGFDVMWDMKLDDIPNTVGNAARNIANLGSKMITLHASAGYQSLAAAAKSVRETKRESLLLAVTVLTSIDQRECVSIFGEKPGPKVVKFARTAIDMGIQGLVCSPKELRALADAGLLKKLVTVVPGVRPEWASQDDQKRVMTPVQAMRAGADLLVIGRPISKHKDPALAARLVWEEIEAA